MQAGFRDGTEVANVQLFRGGIEMNGEIGVCGQRSANRSDDVAVGGGWCGCQNHRASPSVAS